MVTGRPSESESVRGGPRGVKPGIPLTNPARQRKRTVKRGGGGGPKGGRAKWGGLKKTCRRKMPRDRE